MVSGRYQYVFKVEHNYNIPEAEQEKHREDAIFYSTDGDSPWLDDDAIGDYYDAIIGEFDSRYGAVHGGAPTAVSIIATYDNLTGKRINAPE